MILHLYCAVLHYSKEKVIFYVVTLNLYEKREEYSYDVTFFYGRRTRLITLKCLVLGACDEIKLQRFFHVHFLFYAGGLKRQKIIYTAESHYFLISSYLSENFQSLCVIYESRALHNCHHLIILSLSIQMYNDRVKYRMSSAGIWHSMAEAELQPSDTDTLAPHQAGAPVSQCDHYVL